MTYNSVFGTVFSELTSNAGLGGEVEESDAPGKGVILGLHHVDAVLNKHRIRITNRQREMAQELIGAPEFSTLEQLERTRKQDQKRDCNQ